MKTLVIAGNALRRLMRDRSNIFFVAVMPLMLILILGVAFGGNFDPRLGIVANDVGELGQELTDELLETQGLVVRMVDDADALVDDVERGRLEAGVVIPDGYEDAILAGESVALEYVARQDQTAMAMRNTVESALAAQNARVRAAAFASSQGVGDFEEALETATELQAASAVLTVESETVGEAHPITSMGRFDLGAYSQLLLFIFLTSMTGSAALIEQRRLGVTGRMFSTPTSIRTILVGEALGRYAVALTQGVVIMGGSALFFGANWGDPLAAIAIMMLFSLGAAGTGMLFGSIFKNDNQAGGAGVGIGIGLAALGGCMLPLWIMEVFSPTMYTIAHITPHAWGIEAYEKLILDGLGMGDILLELGILAAFAAVMLALATWRLRVTITRG